MQQSSTSPVCAPFTRITTPPEEGRLTATGNVWFGLLVFEIWWSTDTQINRHTDHTLHPSRNNSSIEQVISANADGPRDAAAHPIDHIALHTMTELDVECIHQVKATVDIDSTLLHRPTAAAFSTHMHGEAQTPLIRFVVDMFYEQIRNKYTTNRTRGVWALVYSMASVRQIEACRIGLIVERS